MKISRILFVVGVGAIMSFSLMSPHTLLLADEENVASTTVENVQLHVRYQDSVIFSGTLPLSLASTTTLNDTSGTPHPISSRSALYLLTQAAATTQQFSISDLQYYSLFGAFYINCLDVIATTTVHACGNWQYAVNGSSPAIGADQYQAANNDDVYFYYGNQRIFSVSTSTTYVNSPVTVTVQKYDFTNNAWLPLSGEEVRATQPNPDDTWNPLIIASSTSDTQGNAIIALAYAGQYSLGLKDDGYYSTLLTVASSSLATFTATTTDTSSSNTSPQTTSDGGGGSIQQVLKKTFDVENAIGFLSSHEHADGSFSNDLYTDWAAIAAASYGSSPLSQKLSSYLSTHTYVTTLATDNERHAMALEALGINPYSGTSVNYIQKIIDRYDGTQFGDVSLVNDDIFALFPLLKAGYTASDDIVAKDVHWILAQQASDGSWESIDLTSAALEALTQVESLPGVPDAIQKAKTYLKSHQKDGGFGTSYSTSWALQAVASLNETPSLWSQATTTPLEFLTTYQQTDGGIEATTTDENTRVWATSYAIPAALGKPWPAILTSFPKPTEEKNIPTSVLVPSKNTATTSVYIATSTLQEDEVIPATLVSFVPPQEKSPTIAETQEVIATSTPEVSSTTEDVPQASLQLAAVAPSSPKFPIVTLIVGFIVTMSIGGGIIYSLKKK